MRRISRSVGVSPPARPTRPAMRACSAFTIAWLLAGGLACNRFFSYRPGEAPATDAAGYPRDGARADGGPADLLSRLDGQRAPDGGTRPDGAAPRDSGVQRDASAPRDSGVQRDVSAPRDTGPRPDGATVCGLSTGCHDCEPVQNPLCAALCGVLPECDGLPDTRDPWPTQCNVLDLDEPFFTLTASRWGVAFNGTRSSLASCGWYQLVPPANFTTWIWTDQPPPSSTGAPLLEMRFELPTATTNWEVFLIGDAAAPTVQSFTATDTNPRRLCSVRRVSTTFELYALAQGATNLNHATTNFSPAASSVVLQSWTDGSVLTCRAISGSATADRTVNVPGVLPTKTRSIVVGASNLASAGPVLPVVLDYVRAFRLP